MMSKLDFNVSNLSSLDALSKPNFMKHKQSDATASCMCSVTD